MSKFLYRICVALPLLLISLSSFSAEEFIDPQINLDDLRTPDNPAFAVLGISPTEVIRPSSPKAFALSLLNNGVDGSGGIVSDFAMQISPYWWTSRPNVTWDSYNNTRAGPTVMWQSLAFGIATTEVETTSTSMSTTEIEQQDNTLLGFSVSMDLLRGKPSEKLRNYKEDLESRLTSISEELVLIDIEFIDDPRAEQLFGSQAAAEEGDWDSACAESTAMICTEYQQRVNSILSQEIHRINDNSDERVGFASQLSAAAVYQLEDGNFDKRKTLKRSIWLSFSYVEDLGEMEGASPITFVGLARYNDNKDGFTDPTTGAALDASSFDLGAKVVWESRSNPISASFEYIHRNSDNDMLDNERLVGSVEYVLNENFTIFASVGKNLEDDVVPLFTGDNSMTAIGIKLNTGALTGSAH